MQYSRKPTKRYLAFVRRETERAGLAPDKMVVNSEDVNKWTYDGLVEITFKSFIASIIDRFSDVSGDVTRTKAGKMNWRITIPDQTLSNRGEIAYLRERVHLVECIVNVVTAERLRRLAEGTNNAY